MGGVRPVEARDIESVAALDRSISDSDGRAVEGVDDLETFYATLSFDNPWHDPELPSLVWEDADGKVAGFMGRLPRIMQWRDQRIRMAIATKLMVDPTRRSPFAAVELIRAFFAGPQDLSYSDGATGTTRALWESLGGRSVPAWSVKWAKILRPCRLGFEDRSHSRLMGAVSGLCWPFDRVASRMGPFRVPATQTSVEAIAAGGLTARMSASTSAFTLKPIYVEREIDWLLGFIDLDRSRGHVRTLAVIDGSGQELGWFSYISQPGGVSQALALGSTGGQLGAVLDQLIVQADRDKSVAVQGRIWPRFLDDYWASGCIGKRGAWTVIHARNRDICESVISGDAYLSAIEGETVLPYQRPAP
jgi:hypothetical protein